MTELQAKTLDLFLALPEGNTKNIIRALIAELSKKETALNTTARLAKNSETHLKSAENALIEKDKQIDILKRALGIRNVTVQRQKKQIQTLQGTVVSAQKSLDEAQIKLTLARKQRDEYVKELNQHKETTRAKEGMTAYCAELKKQLESSQKEIQELKENQDPAIKQLIRERDTYKAALKDLMGTFVACSDHNKELAIKCKNILGGNA